MRWRFILLCLSLLGTSGLKADEVFARPRWGFLELPVRHERPVRTSDGLARRSV